MFCRHRMCVVVLAGVVVGLWTGYVVDVCTFSLLLHVFKLFQRFIVCSVVSHVFFVSLHCTAQNLPSVICAALHSGALLVKAHRMVAQCVMSKWKRSEKICT